MFRVILSDIQWAGRRDLPDSHTFEVDDVAESVWRDRFSEDFRGNRYAFQRLLQDVFHVEAERKFGCDITRCRMAIWRPK